jgi:hypothetical protein
MKASLSAFRSTIHDLLSTIVRLLWRHATALRSPSVALTSDRCRSVFSVLRRSVSSRSTTHYLRSTTASPRALLATTVALALTANIASTLATYPHTLSYFNEVAGGPLNGPEQLLDANIDWGQDLLYLKEWYHAHPTARPLHLACFGFITATTAGIDSEPMNGTPSQSDGAGASGFSAGPDPGWYGLSVNQLYGYNHFGKVPDDFASFRELQPAGRVGYSIRLYQIPK